MKTNALYYGDNLDILRRYVPADSIDLVYLDPPFNSNADYNVIFKDESGRKSDAQLVAFEDTWHWGPSAEETYRYLTNTAYNAGKVPSPVSQIVASLRSGIGTNQMLAYLVEMAVRLVELHRVLKSRGTLWLHCDPTASHYLKLVLDAIFGPKLFRNEVIWQRTGAHNDARGFGRITDTLLYYTKSDTYTFHPQHTDYDPEYVAERYRYVDGSGRRFWANTMTAAEPRKNPARVFRGKEMLPPPGTHWRFLQTEIDRLEAEGGIYYSKTGVPYVKSYLDERKGRPLQNLWTDIPMPKSGAERMGYPTQKPLALLERIITATSDEGDIVLDPFCGCGTALVAAQTLGRQWVGIDITYLSIAVMRSRLKTAHGLEDVEVIGQPTEVEGARQLAQSPEGRYQFQWWALGLVDAKPLGGVEKKGSDRGIDGLITFTDKNNELQSVLVSVKSGHVNSGMVRDLKGTLDREKAAIGLFITLDEPTKEMRLEADTSGIFHSELWNRDYPRIQLLSIRELLEEHRKPELPPFVLPTYQQAERVKQSDAQQEKLFGS
jgi:site-specific DNA-methyltransferase (adenine-specific)